MNILPDHGPGEGKVYEIGPQDTTILDSVKRGTKGKLDLNETVTVKLPTGALLGRRVIITCPPLNGEKLTDAQRKYYGGGDRIEESLNTCYQHIFEEFDKTRELVNETLVLSCFSTGAGGVSPELSAKVAVASATKFLKDHPDDEIIFVCYTDELGQKIKTAYKAAVEEQKKKAIQDERNPQAKINLEDLFERIHIDSGDISHKFGDAIVCPMRPDFAIEQSGPTAKQIYTVANLGLENLKQRPPAAETELSEVGKEADIIIEEHRKKAEAEEAADKDNPPIR